MEVELDGAGYFGATLAVVHPIAPTGYQEEEGRKVMLKRFHHWGEMAQKRKIQLALETGYPRSVRAFVALVKDVNHPWVGATLDVGHQSGAPEGIRAYNDTNIALVEQLREKLFHLHVHDIDPATWKEHKPFGTGFIDYPRLITKLREVGYGGMPMLEICAPASEMRGHLELAKKRLEEYVRG
ncbi:MAG: sugar phosphate isomerase/epimerase [Acidobacteriia bacterium]|nr:sugar phosphate isomerase/epimerase [Terriglobia bacterium]